MKLKTPASPNETLEAILDKYLSIMNKYKKLCEQHSFIMLRKHKLANEYRRLSLYLVQLMSANNKGDKIFVKNFSLELIDAKSRVIIDDVEALPEKYLLKSSEIRANKHLVRESLEKGELLLGAKLQQEKVLKINHQE